jgi:fructoselysine-6-P-deglycase FrlB-like protein
MDEMINAQLDLPGLIADSEPVTLLKRHLDDAEMAGRPIIFCGCGTSEHAARAACAILRHARPGATVIARDAFEVCLDPPTQGLLVAVSHSAETAATLDAARNASETGAHSLLVTAQPDRSPQDITAVATPLFDRSWCHTVGYNSPILTVGLGASMTKASAHSVIERELDVRSRRARDAEALVNCDRLLIVGSGVDEITAAELALKIEEAAHIPCTPLGTEKVLHGHLPAASSRTGLIVLRFDPLERDRRDQRAADVIAACAVLDMATVTLRSDAQAPAEALLAGALAAQLVTLEIATALGISPDLIRREEPLYRKVAEVAKAG